MNVKRYKGYLVFWCEAAGFCLASAKPRFPDLVSRMAAPSTLLSAAGATRAATATSCSAGRNFQVQEIYIYRFRPRLAVAQWNAPDSRQFYCIRWKSPQLRPNGASTMTRSASEIGERVVCQSVAEDSPVASRYLCETALTCRHRLFVDVLAAVLPPGLPQIEGRQRSGSLRSRYLRQDPDINPRFGRDQATETADGEQPSKRITGSGLRPAIS